MIFNYFKIAWRNALIHKGFSFINIVGLAIGIICCIFIFLFVESELKYDKHFDHSEDIYRVTTQIKGSQNAVTSMSSPPIAEAMRNEFGEIETAARLWRLPGVVQHLVKVFENDKLQSAFFESDGFLVDSTFFSVFAYPLIYGNPAQALRQPFSIVLSEELSAKYFGKENPVGKRLLIENAWGVYDCSVTGVFKHHTRSHIPARFFMSMHSGEAGQFVLQNQDWVGNDIFCTYLKLRPGTNPQSIQDRLSAFFNSHAAASLATAGISKTLGLERLTSIHLNTLESADLSPRGDKLQLFALSAIGIFILLIACINYMNLATARYTRRNREVGVRKVLGANRSLLIRQFLTESMLLSLLAWIIGLASIMPLLSVFEKFTGKVVETSSIQMGIFGSLLVSMFAGILGGSYPAFYLSSLRPVEALKNRVSHTFFSNTVNLRKGLVVFQFSIAVALIVCSLVVSQQMRFLNKSPLGFNKNQKVVLPLKTIGAEEKYPELKAAVSRLAQVKAVSACTAYPGVPSFAEMQVFKSGESMNGSKKINLNFVDEGFVQMMGFELRHGRYATNQFASDTAGLGGWMINEAAVKVLGLTPQTAVGHKFKTERNKQVLEFEVVGVLKDYHFESLHHQIAPQGFRITTVSQTGYGYLIADVQSGNWHETFSAFQHTWKSVLPDIPFEGRFLDEAIQQNYASEQRAFQLISLFASLAICISCLGLFGLASYAVERRRKEIAIRKIVGASTASVTGLLSKEFLKPVVIALCIASPLSWYLMQNWLENFSYRIQIQWWVFALAGAASIIVALLTVGAQSMKAALSSPVNSLRSE